MGPSSRGLHLLRNDLALMLALLRARLPAACYRRCLSRLQESDRLLAGLGTIPCRQGLEPSRQRLEQTHRDVRALFEQLADDQFSRQDFERVWMDYLRFFAR